MLNIDIFDAFAELVVCIVFKLPHDITNLHGYVQSGEEEKSSTSTQNSSFAMDLCNPSTSVTCAGSLSRASFSSSAWTMAGPLASVRRSTRSPSSRSDRSRSSGDGTPFVCRDNNSHSTNNGSRNSNTSARLHSTGNSTSLSSSVRAGSSSSAVQAATLNTTSYSFVQLSEAEEEELAADRWAVGTAAPMLSPEAPGVCVWGQFCSYQKDTMDRENHDVDHAGRAVDCAIAVAGGCCNSSVEGLHAPTPLLRSCRRLSDGNCLTNASQSSLCENSLSEYIYF